jgi:hypothetical protein
MAPPMRWFALSLTASTLGVGVASADVSFGTSYGGAGNSFTASIQANASFSVQGGGTLKLSSPPILGTPIGLLSADINLPQQTVNISANQNLNLSPTGSGTIRLSDSYNSQQENISSPPAAFPPGSDGRADDGTTLDSQMSASIDALNVTLVNAPVSVGVNNVSLSGSGSFNILGLIPVSVPLRLDLSPSVILQNLNYAQIGPAVMAGQTAINPGFADGAHPNVPGVQNLSTLFASVISGGNLTGQGAANVNAQFTADFGILGSYSQNLGNFSLFNDSLSQTFGLFGQGQFIEIATALNAYDFDDLVQKLSGNISSLLGPLSLPLTLSGSIPVSQTFDAPLSLGFLGTITFRGSFNGSLSYSINGTLTLDNLTYSLQSQQIADAVNVPEAGSLGLMAATSLAGLIVWRRRKTPA